jgi:ubiquinone/menaquinone biosynthesis C-methylase UbiE
MNPPIGNVTFCRFIRSGRKHLDRFLQKFLFLLVLSPLTLFAQDARKDVYRESAWAQRDTWQRPENIIRQLDLQKGDKVADIGCHEGYFTIKLAGTVGDEGRVFAVDIDKDKLDKLGKHLEKRSLKNVSVIMGDENDPKLPVAALDAVLIVDTYHEMNAHDEILQHIKAALKFGGRLVICEPISNASKKLSRPQQEKTHELSMSYAVEDLKKAGFKILYQKDPFVDRSKEKGDTMWILVAAK